MDLGLKNKNALISGGSQGIGFAIAKALAKEGCNVAIGARGRERLEQAGIGTWQVPWAAGARDPVGALRFTATVKRSRSPQIIHQHFGGRSVRWLSRVTTGAAVLVHVHSRGSERLTSERRVLRLPFADAVVAPSRSAADLIEHPFKRVIYTGVGTSAAVARPAETGIVGTLARLVPIKGIDVLIEAVADVRHRLPAIKLEIAGGGPMRSELERLSHRLGCADIVSFLGFQMDIESCLHRWSVFVLPSLDEALPVALLQAMGAGLPVIASAVGGIPEVVWDGRTGLLVPPSNAGALAAAIERLFRDERLRHTIAAAGYDTISRSFSEGRMAAEVAAVYRALLENRR